MENADLTSIAQLADLTLNLIHAAANSSEDEFQQQTRHWISQSKLQIQALGSSSQAQLLMDQFSLDKPTLASLLYIALPVIRSQYQHFFNQLKQPTGPGISLDLVTSLVSVDYAEKNRLSHELSATSALFRWELLLPENAGASNPQRVTLSPELKAFLNEQQTDSTSSSSLLSLLQPGNPELILDKTTAAPKKPIIHIEARLGLRKQAYALQLANELKRPLYQLDNALLNSATNGKAQLLGALKNLALQKGILYWPDADSILNKNPEYGLLVFDWLQLKETTLMVGQTQFTPLTGPLQKTGAATISLKPLSSSQKELVWQSLGSHYLGVSSIDYTQLSNTYYLDEQRITETLKHCVQAGTQEHDTQQLMSSYQATSPQEFTKLASLDSNDRQISDLFLDKSIQNQLSDISKAFLQREALSHTKPEGIQALFEGPTGSGKSMSAMALANSLGLPLYKVNYVALQALSGDPEVNLGKLFSEAQRNSALLLFDHADQFLSQNQQKSNAVLNAALAQHMTAYEGLILLICSEAIQLDKKLVRQSLIKVSFQALTADQQFEIFRKILADLGITLADQNDLTKLVDNLGANGNQIKNIVKNAILSAQEGQVPLDQVVLAAKDLAKGVEMEKNK